MATAEQLKVSVGSNIDENRSGTDSNPEDCVLAEEEASRSARLDSLRQKILPLRQKILLKSEDNKLLQKKARTPFARRV